MKIVIEIPEKTYQKIIAGTYDYGDMNVIIQNGTQYDGRPHGEWIESINDNICSVCKQNSLTHWKSPFCPCCGAKMHTTDKNTQKHHGFRKKY